MFNRKHVPQEKFLVTPPVFSLRCSAVQVHCCKCALGDVKYGIRGAEGGGGSARAAPPLFHTQATDSGPNKQKGRERGPGAQVRCISYQMVPARLRWLLSTFDPNIAPSILYSRFSGQASVTSEGKKQMLALIGIRLLHEILVHYKWWVGLGRPVEGFLTVFFLNLNGVVFGSLSSYLKVYLPVFQETIQF